MPDAPLAARDCAAFGWAVRDAPPRMAYREQSRGACVLLTSGRHERCIHQQATAECRLQRSKRKPCRGERGNLSNRVAVRDPLRSDLPGHRGYGTPRTSRIPVGRLASAVAYVVALEPSSLAVEGGFPGRAAQLCPAEPVAAPPATVTVRHTVAPRSGTKGKSSALREVLNFCYRCAVPRHCRARYTRMRRTYRGTRGPRLDVLHGRPKRAVEPYPRV